ncbi:protein dead ringer homolog [Acanthaster planci]|uniref:Protein dead ringer homolog n=1 Tax=Acanthaster planci TaxID=133434 RepID=A0A8B7Y543_ACAPL|nr:protein dead ringer homolog [Acanthaster planci]
MERTGEVLEQGRSNGVQPQHRILPPKHHHPFYSQAMTSTFSVSHARRQEILRRLEMMNGRDDYDSDEMDGELNYGDEEELEEDKLTAEDKEIDLSLRHLNTSKLSPNPHPIFPPRHYKTSPPRHPKTPPPVNGGPVHYESHRRRKSLSPTSAIREYAAQGDRACDRSSLKRSSTERSLERPSVEKSPSESPSSPETSERFSQGRGCTERTPFERCQSERCSSDDEANSLSCSNQPEDYSIKLEKPSDSSLYSEDENNISEDTKPVSPTVFKEAGKPGVGGQSEWTFEEQFKQLYELSDDRKRKEFLNELFSFMQKRGTPVNRIPIMAKQVLDLYELFNLVTSKGGLVEVINKKQWREITKGLNLPASITSAAFTLRTQYMKYLYPFECEKRKLSTPSELQAAIDGNRREGRRQVYTTNATGFGLSPHSPTLPTMIPHPSVIPHNVRDSPEFEEERDARDFPFSRSFMQPRMAKHPMKHALYEEPLTPPPKRPLLTDEQHHRYLLQQQQHQMVPPAAHIKVTSNHAQRDTGLPLFELRGDNSLIVSIELNGVLYQGVLYPRGTPLHVLTNRATGSSS